MKQSLLLIFAMSSILGVILGCGGGKAPVTDQPDTDFKIESYKGIGDVFKQNFPGFEGWIISSSFDAMKFIGLRPSRKIHLFNGPIETRFFL